MHFLWVNVTFHDAVNMIHDVMRTVNPLPDYKILDWSKLKQIADNILSAHKMKSLKCHIG